MAALTDTVFKGGDPARMGMLVAGLAFGVAALASWWLLERKDVPAPGIAVERVEVVPTGTATALLRLTVPSVVGPTPALLVDDGDEVHRLDPLPAGSAYVNGTRSLGYGVPQWLLATGRDAIALEVGGGRRLAVTLPA
jgi:hypothetical protein